MTLTEIYEQQQRELERLKTLRDNAWSELQEEQRSIAASFGGSDKLPDDLRKRFDGQVSAYHHEWAMDTGERFREMRQLHEQQRENMTGIEKAAREQPGHGQAPAPDPLTDKQMEMQKIIAQQQAIRKRNQEKNRKR